MKYQIAFVSILLFFQGVSQDFNGDYKSFKTSFQDCASTENNFIEESEFNVVVVISKDKNEGFVSIQDPRIPNKILTYRVTEFIREIENKGIVYYLYRSQTEHLENSKETILTFYYPKDKKLSFMIYDKESSQAFFDLKTIK